MRAHTLSINGFALVSGVPARFSTFVTDYVGVVARTGSGAVLLRQVDGTEVELGQSSITEINPLTDAELILFGMGIAPR